ncbi:MAG: FHA domain-containing protein [Bacteroidia bacterium]|nr:FHA domain-containing protein [Bacteroidia bacterium]
MKMHYTALTGGILVLVGSFLPWISVVGVLALHGYETQEGAVTIVIGLFAVIIAMYNIINKKDKLNFAYIISGFLVLCMGIYDIQQIQKGVRVADRLMDMKGILVEYLNIMGMGLWVIGLGALLLLGVGIMNSLPKNRLKVYPNPFPENRQIPSAPSPQPVPKRTAYLSGMTGSYAGQQIPVPEEGLVIGRDPSQCSLVVHSPSISRRHARISQGPTPDCWILEDLNSTNGTFVQERSSWIRVASPVTLTIFRRFRLGDNGNEFEIL